MKELNTTEPSVNTTQVDLAYAGESVLNAQQDSATLSLFGNLKRDAVKLQAEVTTPLLLREALATLYDVVGSDYRYAPKDRSDYQAYRRMRNESANSGSWKAQQAYFNWLLRNDPMAFLILDPIISVHPDQLSFDLFSKDEGTYASLAIDLKALELKGEPEFGTTNIDFSERLNETLQQSRSYRSTHIDISQQAVKVDVSETEQHVEKQIQIPDNWLRGCLQVQSAAMLPKDTFELAPVDLYNLLRQLRMHSDIKGKGRGLRVELIPGEAPRLVLEPWEVVLTGSAGVYTGKQAKVVKLWGRRRLMQIKRLLPFIERIEVSVSGSGLPSFWVMHCGALTFTFALTGFTANDWSQATSFDLLMPRQTLEKTEKDDTLIHILTHLKTCWFDSLNGLVTATGFKKPAILASLQHGCQIGQLTYDIAKDVYRLRPLTDQPIDLSRLEFRNKEERHAHDLLARKQAVTISSENRIYGKGIEITAKVDVKEDKREYRTQLLINDDGYLNKAECSCSKFRQQGLKAGPCSHLIAVRLTYQLRENKRKTDNKARKTITAETRTYCKRLSDGEHIMQISLEKKRITLRTGRSGEDLRLQRLQFNSVEQARIDYLNQLQRLESDGYLNASAG